MECKQAILLPYLSTQAGFVDIEAFRMHTNLI